MSGALERWRRKEPGLYRLSKSSAAYQTITSSHLTLQTKQGRIKNFKLSGVTRQVETTGAQLLDNNSYIARLVKIIKNTPEEIEIKNNDIYEGALIRPIVFKVSKPLLKSGNITFSAAYVHTGNIEEVGVFSVALYWGNDGNSAAKHIKRMTTASQTGNMKLTAPLAQEDIDNNDYTHMFVWCYCQSKTSEGILYTSGLTLRYPMLYQDGDGTWEPYTGTQPSPSPEYPQDVQGVGVRTAQMLDFTKDITYGGCTLVDADTGTIKCDIVNDYYCVLKITYLNDYIMAHKGGNLTFYADQPLDTWLSIIIDGTRSSGKTYQEATGKGKIVKATIADDFTSVRFMELRLNRKSSAFTDTDTVIPNIMLCEGTAVLPYEPYGYRTDVVCRTEDDTESYTAPIYTREPVYDGDSIQLVSGQYCHVQNSMTVDGASVKWVEQATDVTPFDDSYYSHAAVPGVLSAREYSNIKSTHFPKYETIKTANANGTFLYNGLLGARLLGITTLDAFKSWMAEHNPQFLLPRAEPRIDPLPAISQQALRNLPTYKGTTIIDTTDPLDPEITVSYRPQTDYSKLPGLEADYEKGIYTRLGAAKNLTAGAQFNRFPMYAGRRRCNVSDDGTITAYYGDPDYKEDGSNGQVMVYQPKFYYQVVPLKLESQTDGIGYHLRRAQYWVSPKPQPGFKLHPAFINASGQEVDHILLSAYESSLYDTSAATYILDDAQVMDVEADKLCSISGARPASGSKQNFTRTAIEQLAQNRGPGWHGDLIKPVSAEQLLMIIEMGMMNLQTAIAQGVVSLPYAVGDDTTSSYAAATGSTSAIGNGTGRAETTTTYEGGVAKEYTVDGKTSVCWRGTENPWGNIWKFVYGINIWGNGAMGGGQPFICTDFNFAESKNSGNYEGAGFTVANKAGYISAMGYSTKCDWLFIASECLGNSSLPVGDYHYITPNLNGYRIALLGGDWVTGGSAGAFSWNLNYGVSDRYRAVGGRLIYVPQ